MRYLGIDFGSKNIGLAISDESGSIAFPDRILSNDKKTIPEIIATCQKQKIKGLVMGESRNFEGKPNPIMIKALDFGEKLELATGLKIETEPEYLTSHQASNIQGSSNQIDASAAAIILQSYLDRKQTKSSANESADDYSAEDVL